MSTSRPYVSAAVDEHETRRLFALDRARRIVAALEEPGMGTLPEDIHWGHVGDMWRIDDALRSVEGMIR